MNRIARSYCWPTNRGTAMQRPARPIGKRGRGQSGRWARNRYAARLRRTKASRGAKHAEVLCGSALKLTLAKSNCSDNADASLEIEWDKQGGGLRLAIKGNWGTQGDGYGFED